MNRIVKIGMVSAFVYPGAGHLLLKRYVMAVVLIVLTTVSLGYTFVKAVSMTTELRDGIESGEVLVETMPELIEMLKSTYLQGGDAAKLKLGMLMATLFWMVGVGDSIRLAKKEEEEDAPPEAA